MGIFRLEVCCIQRVRNVDDVDDTNRKYFRFKALMFFVGCFFAKVFVVCDGEFNTESISEEIVIGTLCVIELLIKNWNSESCLRFLAQSNFAVIN